MGDETRFWQNYFLVLAGANAAFAVYDTIVGERVVAVLFIAISLIDIWFVYKFKKKDGNVGK